MRHERTSNPAISRGQELEGHSGGLRRRGGLDGAGERRPAMRRAGRTLLVLALAAGSLVSLATSAAAQEPSPAPLLPPVEAVPVAPAPGGEQAAPGIDELAVAPPAQVPPVEVATQPVPPGQVPPSPAPATQEPAPQVQPATPDVLTGRCLVLLAPPRSIAAHPAPVAPPANVGQSTPAGAMPATDPFATTVPGAPTGDVLVPAEQTPPQGTTAPVEGAAVEQVEFHAAVPNQVLIVILESTSGACNVLFLPALGATAALAPSPAPGSGATAPEQALVPVTVPPTAPGTTAPAGDTEDALPAPVQIPAPPTVTPAA